MKKLIASLLVISALLSNTVFALSTSAAAGAEFTKGGAETNNMTVTVGKVSTTPATDTKGGVECWKLGTTSAENTWLTIDVAPAAATAQKQNFRLDITYFDHARGRVILKYNDIYGVRTVPIFCTGTEAWKTKSLNLYGLAVSSTADIQLYSLDAYAWSAPSAPFYLSKLELYRMDTTMSATTTFTTTGLNANFTPGTQTIGYNLSNRTSDIRTYTINYKAYDEDNNILWQQNGVQQKMAGDSSKPMTVSMNITKYGVHKLVLEIADDKGGYSEETHEFAVISAEQTKPNQKFGVSAHFSWKDSHIQTMPMLKKMGASIVRDEVPWFVYRNNGNKIPDRHNAYIDAAVEAGMDVLLVLTSDVVNATSNFPDTDAEYEEFGEYVYNLVNDTKGRVKYFEVWNEYNQGGGDSTAEQKALGQAYARLVKVAHDAAELANPEAKIVGPVTAGYSYPFGVGMTEYDANIADYVDIISFHTYPRDNMPEDAEFLSSRKWCVDELRNIFGDDKPMWLTETGFFEYDYGLTEKEEAMYNVRYMLFYNYENLYDRMLNYNWINCGESPEHYGYNFGIINNNYAVKKKYIAYDVMNKFMADATLINRTIDANNNYIYKYSIGSKKELTVLYNADNLDKNITVTPSYTHNKLYDLYGNEIALTENNGSYTIAIGAAPVYLVSEYAGVDMDYSTNQASIKGTIEGAKAGEQFILYVLNPDKVKNDIPSANALYYIEQGTIAADGTYSFSFPMTADAGEYDIYIGYKRGGAAIGPATLNIKRDVVASTSLFAGTTKITTLEQLSDVAEEKLTVKANIDNSYNAKLNAMLYVAGYKGGSLAWANLTDATPTIVGKNEASFEIDKADAMAADEVRIFLWKDSNAPLVENITPIE